MNKRQSVFLASLILGLIALVLAQAVTAQPDILPGQTTHFQSPIVTPTATRPPLCPPGETRPDCVPWRPTPPPPTLTPEPTPVPEGARMHSLYLPLVVR